MQDVKCSIVKWSLALAHKPLFCFLVLCLLLFRHRPDVVYPFHSICRQHGRAVTSPCRRWQTQGMLVPTQILCTVYAYWLRFMWAPVCNTPSLMSSSQQPTMFRWDCKAGKWSPPKLNYREEMALLSQKSTSARMCYQRTQDRLVSGRTISTWNSV